MNSGHQPRRRFLLTVLCFLVLLGTAILWILNVEVIVAGPWATILNVFCTVLGVLFTFLQWQQSSSSHIVKALKRPLASPLAPSGRFAMPRTLGVNKQQGALIVKARKSDLGITIHLCSGFTTTPTTAEFAANVTERESGTCSVSVAIFPNLTPGNYTVFLPTPPRYAFVTIYAGQVADIDWRIARAIGKGESHGL